MHILIVLAIVIGVVGLVVYLTVTASSFVALILTAPSRHVMSLVQYVGLTDRFWYVALHAALGGMLGFWAHLARPRIVKVVLALIVVALLVVSFQVDS